MKPKILALDIETSPLITYTWGLFDQNIGLNQIHSDWFILAWCAKWVGDKEIFYRDLRGFKGQGDDKKILAPLHTLLNECDVVVTQNGRKFDAKKINARFIMHGFDPPQPYKHIDTLALARRHFGFTSNKLAYMTDKLCTKYKKLTHHKFEGFELWKECLKDNSEAWREMQKYNTHDVLSLEELYLKLSPWDTTVNLSLYTGNLDGCPSCQSKKIERRGFAYTKVGKYQRYQCRGCGSWSKDGINLLKGLGAGIRRTV